MSIKARPAIYYITVMLTVSDVSLSLPQIKRADNLTVSTVSQVLETDLGILSTSESGTVVSVSIESGGRHMPLPACGQI